MQLDFNPIDLFSMYMKLTGVPTLEVERGDDASLHDVALRGKTLGIVNGSSWVSLWSTYFGRQILPGVKLVNIGNEGVQLNFMGAHKRGEPCPPQINIDLFVQYAEDLVKLYKIDAIIITNKGNIFARSFIQCPFPIFRHRKDFFCPVIFKKWRVKRSYNIFSRFIAAIVLNDDLIVIHILR